MQRVFIVLFFLAGLQARAQVFPRPSYPQGYFRNPLDIPMELSGNFGELRPNHYHMGLDIKTQRRQNLAVHAAADGYIARIKIEPGGFGRAIYINHPNGYTTVYCHLNDFFPALEAWVSAEQYRLESWKVFLDLPPDLFPVKKGAFIAYSGTTGGSEAPHLHFEIRKTEDDVNCNPLLFGMPLPDHIAPRVNRLALYNREGSIYEQSPRFLPLKKLAGGYATGPVVVPFPRIGLALSAADSRDGAKNFNGIFEALLSLDGRPRLGFRMDQISYNDTRGVNAHIDYKTRAGGGPWLQQLFRLPGYTHSIYQPEADTGTLDLSDGKAHEVRIAVQDANGNSTLVTGSFRYQAPARPLPAPAVPGEYYRPGMLELVETPEAEFILGEHSLYEAVHLQTHQTAATRPDAVSPVWGLGTAAIPLNEALHVRIRAAALTPAKRARVVMLWTWGSKKEVQPVEWKQDWATATFSSLGEYQLVLDETPPEILPVGFAEGANLGRAASLTLKVTDNLGQYKKFRAELDGKWLRFTNDKGLAFSYRFDDKCPAGSHTLKVSVEDQAGNRTEKIFHFTR